MRSDAPYAPLEGAAELEHDLLTLSNDARQAAGLGALEPDERLTLAVRHHAAEMAELGYFSHTSPVAANATLARHIARSGSFVRTLGENLALVGKADTARASVSGWLKSPGHRANLLHPGFTHLGFGAAPYPDGRVAVAQVLGYQPATLEEAQLASVLLEEAQLSATVTLTTPGEVALFYDERSSPPQPLAAGEHTLEVPLTEPLALPLSVQLGVREAGTSGSFILQDDGWLHETGWQGRAQSSEAPEGSARLLRVGLNEVLARALELRLTFAETPPSLSAWQGDTLLPLGRRRKRQGYPHRGAGWRAGTSR